MQLTKTLAAAIFAASTALASPTDGGTSVAAVSMMADAPLWTIESLKRVCAADDSVCTWTFGVNTNDGTPSTNCTLEIKQAQASHATNGGPATCGPFTVTSGWNGSFGEGRGFTVLSVVDYAKWLIVWPGYADREVQAGNVVSPNKSYAPQRLP